MRLEDMVKSSADAVKVNPEVGKWLEELDSAFKREKAWRKDASHAIELYECGKRKESPFNILYSNTETLAPALYNNLPRPVVQRRFKDENPMGRACSQVVQRTLEFLIDNTLSSYTPFDSLMEEVVLSALVPGRGVVWFKYDAMIVQVPDPKKELPEAGEEAEGKEAPPAEERVAYETVCGELVPWDRFRCGYGKVWEEVPWIAREHYFTRTELVKNFGEVGNQVKLDVIPKSCSDGDKEDSSEGERVADAEGAKLARVYEIWDKESKMVRFLATGYPQDFVKSVEDPLGLSNFFPTPPPLHLFPKVSSMVPVTLYAAYEEQARELNRVSVRINKITDALRVRGFYDNTVEGIEKVLEAEDNTLIPAENVAALHDGKTLEKSIWLMPLNELITVLQQLYVQRQQVKQVIYEINGISDILRGASVASETATAQNIKNQWGTLRLKRLQKRVMVYARECLRIMAEVAVTKFSPKTLAAMTGLTYPTGQQKQQAGKIVAAARQAQAAGQQLPPPPPAALQFAALPSWEQLQQLLQDDLQRSYQIDIETNSTVDAEATEDKQNVGEFLNAVAQFMNGAAPLVEQGILPFETMKTLLLAVTRRYRFGPEVEDELKKMQPPQQASNTEAQQKELQKQTEEVKKQGEEVQSQRAEFEAHVREEMAKLKEAQAELDLNRKFALQEVEQAKKLAEREIQNELQLNETTSKAMQSAREEAIEIKLSAQQQEVEKQQKDLEGKKQAKAKEDESSAQALIQMLEKLLEGVNTPRTARKLPDGSWTTASDTKH